jgi:hypothetical protein
MEGHQTEQLVLGLAPTTRGVGFVVFEDIDSPVDWGVKEVRQQKNKGALAWAEELFLRYQPAVLVVEDCQAPGSRREPRICKLLDAIVEKARRRRITVHCYSRATVIQMFKARGAHNKDDIAAAIVELIPELGQELPRRRRIWESEHYTMAVFEAAALAMTYYRFESRQTDIEQP